MGLGSVIVIFALVIHVEGDLVPILKIAPGVVVNTDHVQCVEIMDHTDAYAEPHVVVQYKTYGRNIPPEYTLEEITAALNGLCYYRTQWTDEVGEVDVCVIHGQNSRHSPDTHEGPHRPCLQVDPYIEYTFPGMMKINHAPSIYNSWEYKEKEKKDAVLKALDSEKPIVMSGDTNIEPKLGPVASYFADGGITPESDHSATSFGVAYEDYRRPWWKRLIGIN